MISTKHSQAVLTILLCALVSVLIGLAVYGARIFNHHTGLFQFVCTGVASGVFVAAFRYYGARVGLLAVPVVLVAFLALTKSSTSMFVLRDVVSVVGWCAAAKICLVSSGWYPRLVVGKFILWAAVFGFVYLCVFAILILANSVPFDPQMASTVTKLGALIGAGVGLGFELSELLWSRSRSAGPAVVQGG